MAYSDPDDVEEREERLAKSRIANRKSYAKKRQKLLYGVDNLDDDDYGPAVKRPNPYTAAVVGTAKQYTAVESAERFAMLAADVDDDSPHMEPLNAYFPSSTMHTAPTATAAATAAATSISTTPRPLSPASSVHAEFASTTRAPILGVAAAATATAATHDRMDVDGDDEARKKRRGPRVARAERDESSWATARAALSKHYLCSIGRSVEHLVPCRKCSKGNAACIHCDDCMTWMCTDCDETVHRCLPCHNRQAEDEDGRRIRLSPTKTARVLTTGDSHQVIIIPVMTPRALPYESPCSQCSDANWVPTTVSNLASADRAKGKTGLVFITWQGSYVR